MYNNKVFIATVNEIEVAIKNPLITGAEILKEAGFENIKCHTLYQKLNGCDFEKISLDEIVDFSKKGVEHFVTKEAETFDYFVNDEPETSDKKQLTAHDILIRAGIDSKHNYLVQILEHAKMIDYSLNPEQPIKMLCTGMKFISVKWLDVVDIEEYGKNCKEVPSARQYRIKIDKDYHFVSNQFITAKEIISLQGKTSIELYDVYQFFNGNPKPKKINHNEQINLKEKCLVRFVLQPKEQQDGRENRRFFTLPDEDIETLDKLGLHWETLSSGGFWLIIYDYTLPKGYNLEKVDLALMIPPNYPATEIDMAYFFPPLQKLSLSPIKAIDPQVIDGKTFQRWSRHRLHGEWRPGIDDVSTHLCLVDNWLLKDLNR